MSVESPPLRYRLRDAYSENIQRRFSRKRRASNENTLFVIFDLTACVLQNCNSFAVTTNLKLNLESKGGTVRKNPPRLSNERSRGWLGGWSLRITQLVEGGESFVIVLSISLSPAAVRLAPEINVLYGGRTPWSAHAARRKLNG